MFRRTGVLLLALMLACTACGNKGIEKDAVKQDQLSAQDFGSETNTRKQKAQLAKKQVLEETEDARWTEEKERSFESKLWDEETRGYSGHWCLYLRFPRGEEYDHAFEKGESLRYPYYVKFVDHEPERVFSENFVVAYDPTQEAPLQETAGSFSEGLFAAMDLEKDRKIGFLDEEGDPVIPTIFDWIPSHFHEGVVPVLKDGRWGILKNPLSLEEQYKEEKKYFEESELEITWLEGFDEHYILGGFSEGLAAFTHVDQRNEQGAQIGFIDKEGRIRIPLGGPDGGLRSSEELYRSFFQNGRASFVRHVGDEVYEEAVIDKEGNYLQEWRKLE